MYSAQLLDHFEHPRNSGELPDADVQVRIENPACGDILELAIKLMDGRIADIRFRAKGCVPAMACASAMTEMAKGKSLQTANAIGKTEVLAVVGGLPPASGHAAQLAVDALRAALKQLGKL
jgi:nitrogen fixation NifU-like protein